MSKNLPHISKTTTSGTRPLLYRFVFSSTYSLAFVLVLLVSFTLQSVERAFADETDMDGIAADIIERVEEADLPVITDIEIEAAISEGENAGTTEEVVADGVGPNVSASEDQPEIVTTEELPAEPASDQELESLPTTEVEAVETPDTLESENGDVEGIIDQNLVPADGQATTSEDELDISVEDVPIEEVSLEEVIQSELTTDVATSTVASSTSLVASTSDEIIMVESSHYIQFDKSNCLAVEDGSFYCQQSTTTTSAVEDGLYSLPDSDGDLEIYLRQQGELTQLSNNQVDDASPYYDPVSESLVWQRFVDDRYQIIVYDIASGDETQLTDTTTNNMEPFRAGDIIVWQHWANNAWQIMMYDGSKLTPLTNTPEHNLAPVVRNDLVVWNRITAGEKSIEVFDLTTSAYMTIKDTDGGTITNPRMVLVYDALMENGDTVTRGYNLVTGEVDTFAATATPLPAEIPDPDTTGETRALIQPKASQEEVELILEATPDTSTPTTSTSTASSTQNTDALDSEIASSTTNVAGTTDLILDLRTETPETTVATSPMTLQIPDVIVTPFTGSDSSREDTSVAP